MRSIKELKRVKEKICMDFYPKCTHCTCFQICFPNNSLNDVLSEALEEL